MNTFANLHLVKDPEKRNMIRDDLLAYCRLDTMAMVKNFQNLSSESGRESYSNFEL